jgi:hypothetical protein
MSRASLGVHFGTDRGPAGAQGMFEASKGMHFVSKGMHFVSKGML